MSVTRIGPFTSGPSSSPSSTSSHQRGSRAAAPVPLAGDAPRRSRRSPRRCTARSRSRRSWPAWSAFVPLGPDHQPVLAGQRPARRPPRTPRPTTRAPPDRRTRPALSCTPTSALRRVDPGARAQRVPPLPERPGVERVHPAERVALHQRLHVALEPGDLVLADERVAADQVGRGDRARPNGCRRRSPGRTTAGCRRRRPRPRGGTRPRSARGSAGAWCGAGRRRCAPAAAPPPRR